MNLTSFIALLKGNALPLAIGYASAHAVQMSPSIAGFLFQQALKWPWLRAKIVANPARAKAIVDAVSQEIDKDIDTAATQPTTTPAA